MKNKLILRVLLLSIIVLTTNLVKAQVTITSASVPSSAENIIYSSSNDSIDVSVAGANQAWDFSKITPTSQDTYKYAKPTGLYQLSFFGDLSLNLNIAALKGAYSFFKTTSTEYYQAGMGITLPTVNIPTAIPFNTPDVIYHFPVKYGNVDSSTYSGSATLIAGLTITIIGKRVNTVDGWGTVKTPYKTFNCLRIKSVVTETDSLVGTAIDNSRIEYKWLATNEQIPVMEAVVTNNPATGSTMTLNYPDSFRNIVNPNAVHPGFYVADTNVYINQDTVKFIDTTKRAFTYAWNITPSTFKYVGGTTDTSKNPKVVFNAVGLYTVGLTANGLTSGSLTKKNYINAIHNSGIVQIYENHGLSIYPNPTSGDLFLHLSGNLNTDKAEISVTNIFGQTMLQKTVGAGQNDVKLLLNGFSSGVYLVKCQVGEESFVEKVVVR